ncbi:hypothetical protein [Pasteurella multocida]|uniref:hypothetical protein n=1 Tax=Pasteurella multocida TaxID=747 RepID=UPI0020232AEF|nr:hypothetical protein [Pasteurella multocida]URH98297.1 hypothetical protein M8854_10515 [Pasteurella multocida]
MKSYKFLPKQAYSISDAVKYISLNYDITISEIDLLQYIQTGDLQASIYLDGRTSKVDSINRKEVDKNNPLLVRKERIFLKFSQLESAAKISYDECFELFSIELKNIYFELDIYLMDRKLKDKDVLESYFNKNDVIKIHYWADSDKPKNIIFRGYFPLSKRLFETYNIAELYEKGFLDEFDDIIMNIDQYFYFYLPFEENKLHYI